MSDYPQRLALGATSGAALLVLLLYGPSLQAPFLVPKFAALELSASIGFFAFALRRATTGRPQWVRPLSGGAMLVLLCAALSWVVAAARPEGASYASCAVARWAAFLGLACGASALDDVRDDRHRALVAVTIAAATVAAIGLLQHVGAMPLPIPVFSAPGSTFGNRNVAAEVMAVALPLGAGAAVGTRHRGERVAVLAGLALEIVYLAVTRTRGAWLGAACGLGTALWLARLRWNRASLAIGAAVVVAACVAAALPGRFDARYAGDRKRYAAIVDVVHDGFDVRSRTLRTRIGLWRRTLRMIGDHPLLGVGPGNWPVMFPRYAEPGAARDGVLSATLAPRQAHNDLLEHTAETGIIGLAALAALAAAAAVAVRRRLHGAASSARATTAAAAGALVGLVTTSAASFPLEMPATLALGGIALGLVAEDPRRLDVDAPTPRSALASRGRLRALVPVAAGFLFACGALVRAERSVRASWWLGQAERRMHAEQRGPEEAAEALMDLERALQASPRDFRANLRAAHMKLRQGRPIESSYAAAGALATEPHSPNAHAALAAAELSGGDYAGARRDATQALELLADYPLALQIRAMATEQDEGPKSAQADRERLAALATGPEDDDTARAARALLAPPP